MKNIRPYSRLIDAICRAEWMLLAKVLVFISALALVTLADAAIQTRGQQMCIVKMNKAARVLSKRVAKRSARCFREPGNEMTACIDAAMLTTGKTVLQGVEAKRCHMEPDFGFGGASIADNAVRETVLALTRDFFGPGLVAVFDVDGATADCQRRLHAAYQDVLGVKMRSFERCKQRGLRLGTINGSESLASCSGALSTDCASISVDQLPSWTSCKDLAKVAKGVERAAAILEKHCTGVAQGATAAGACADDPNLTRCLGARASCRACQLLNSIDVVGIDCDLLDDGDASNESCQQTPSTTSTTTATTPTTTYTTTTLPNAVCGDGRVDIDEQCDDGNTMSGDCCSADCLFENMGASCGDDLDPCTRDTCDGAGLCVHAPDGGTCSDGIACPGSETDIDCGGLTCPACAVGAACEASSDCATGICRDQVCGQPLPCNLDNDWAVAADDLLVSYDFDEGMGLQAYDGSGVTGIATLERGASWVPGKSGTAVSLDGVDDRVRFNEGPQFDLAANGGISISFWLYLNETPNENGDNFDVLLDNGYDHIVFVERAATTGRLVWRIDDSDDVPHRFRSVSEIDKHRWYHVLVTWDGMLQKIYLDGELDASRELPITPDVNIDGKISLGGASAPTRWVNGAVDDLRIYRRALTENEIDCLFNRADVCGEEIIVENGNARLVLGGCQPATVRSLTIAGEEMLGGVTSLASVRLVDGRELSPRRIRPLDDDRYRLSFFASDIELVLRITPEPSYFRIAIDDVVDAGADIDEITFFAFDPLHVPDQKADAAWVRAAGDDTAMVHALPLDRYTVCSVRRPGVVCRASRWLSDVTAGGNGAAIRLTTKGSFDADLEALVNNEGLMNTVLPDGRWLRRSNEARESYLFATLTEGSKELLVDLAERGEFGYFTMISPVKFGSYSVPRSSSFADLSALKSAASAFRARGIRLGMHSHYGRVNYEDPLWTDRPEWSVSDTVYAVPFATLAEPVGATDTTLTVNEDLSLDATFAALFGGSGDRYRKWGRTLLIENELIDCADYSGDRFFGCTRGRFNTTPVSHATGVQLSSAPRGPDFFVNPTNSELMAETTAGVADLAADLDLRFLYFDGHATFYPPQISADIPLARSLGHLHTVLPYLDALPAPAIAQFGGGVSPFGWYYSAYHATNDGVVFKNKDFTRNTKAVTAASESPLAHQRAEIGWWKIHGADFESGRYDYDATTADDVHYAMVKMLANDTRIGAQLSNNYASHAELTDRADLIGAYHRLAREQRSTDFIPTHILDYLRDPAHEAELSTASGRHLVEKNVVRAYAVWDEDSDYCFDVDNPFSRQPLEIEIRPRFDYHPFDDTGHLEITDFVSNVTVSKFARDGAKTADVSCDLVGGELSAAHTGSKGIGGCKIEIAANPNLAFKRGLGLRMTGDGNGSQVRTQLAWLNSIANRDNKFRVDFDGQRDVVLGDPTTDHFDYVDGARVSLGADASKSRSWAFDYAGANIAATVYVQNLRPGSTHNLTFESLLGLREKSGVLADPTVRVGNAEVTFDGVSLRIDNASPYLLHFEGTTNSYRLYTSRYGQVGTGAVPALWLEPGPNEVCINSSILDKESIQRADLRVTLVDDQDGDGIPTNGDFDLDVGTPCDGEDVFCDDNCPDIANPDQLDSDGDGQGDLCDM